MNDLSEARSFNKLLKLRSLFKQLNQITWSVRAAEERFPAGTPQNDASLLMTYESICEEFIPLAEKIKTEAQP